MTILIVEDSPMVAEAVARGIKSRNRNTSILVASNLHQALAFMSNADAVLCDGLNGDWAKVWASAVKRRVHFVLFSGDEQAVTQAKLLGIPALLKPASAQAIIAYLNLGVYALA